MLAPNITGTNLLTKFHEDRKINVASRVLTRKNAPPLAAMMNLLTKFHEDRTLNVVSRNNLLTKFHEDWTINVASREKFPAPGGHVFKATKTIFELIEDIIGTHLQTKFHDDRKIKVTSRVLTSGHAFLPIHTIFELNQKTAPPPGGHFHDNWAKIVTSRVFTRNTAPPPGGHVFQRTRTIF
ncbi:hypothetical protein DPMN_083402 [Dreissena polymorpha]|uniref:Uncharacterized protein n=1 Tax=Dreissena polymorpha TaxID=45954 RepID=A0A9D3Y8T5_DREPO|nr:hypothetical protein DPMN_083402 [Dreissena polymorpha]